MFPSLIHGRFFRVVRSIRVEFLLTSKSVRTRTKSRIRGPETDNVVVGRRPPSPHPATCHYNAAAAKAIFYGYYYYYYYIAANDTRPVFSNMIESFLKAGQPARNRWRVGRRIEKSYSACCPG